MKDQLQEKALDYLEKFERLAVEYTPQVIDAGLNVVRIDGMQNIAHGLIGISVFLLSIYIPIRIHRKYRETIRKWGDLYIPLIVLPFIPALFSIFFVFNLFDIWNYIAIFNPELYIAHSLIEGALR